MLRRPKPLVRALARAPVVGGCVCVVCGSCRLYAHGDACVRRRWPQPGARPSPQYRARRKLRSLYSSGGCGKRGGGHAPTADATEPGSQG